VPFDQIIPAVVAGEFDGQAIDAGLIIHEGQLTYGDHRLQLIVDLGRWWKDRTGLPLPLGANVLRKNLGTETVREVQRLLKASIEYGWRIVTMRCDTPCVTGAIWIMSRPTNSSACT